MKKIKSNLAVLIFLAPLFYACIPRVPDNPNPGQVVIHEKLFDGFKVCIVGDTGKHHEGQRLVADTLLAEGCDQVRHTGDIIYGEGLDSADDPAFKERFQDYYAQMYQNGIPFHMSQGNHDYKKFPESWLELAKRHEGIEFPSMYSMDIYGDICLLTIDTNAFPFKQVNWLKRLKSQYKATCKMTLAFGHHPKYSSGKHGNATVLIRTFLNNMVSGKLDAYFAGHEHNQEDIGVIDGTHYFVTGAGAEYRFIKYKPKLWAQAKLGYQIVTVHYKDEQPFLNYAFYSIDEETKVKKIERTGSISGVGFR